MYPARSHHVKCTQQVHIMQSVPNKITSCKVYPTRSHHVKCTQQYHIICRDQAAKNTVARQPAPSWSPTQILNSTRTLSTPPPAGTTDQWWPGEGPRAWGLQTTDCHPKHQLTHMHTLPSHHIYTGAGTAQWLEHRTSDWKVTGLNPCRSGGRIFFSRVEFLCWLLFRYPFHPRVTAVARKRSWSVCQKAQAAGYS